MTSLKITPQNYVFKFGKYKDMKAVDVAEIYTVDKDGHDVPKGLLYLQWICDQDWFKHSDIIRKIIADAKECMSEKDETKPVTKPESKKKKRT